MNFNPRESAACAALVTLALEEDVVEPRSETAPAPSRKFVDLTTLATIPPTLAGKACFVARADGVLAGLGAVAMVAGEVSAALTLKPSRADGDCVTRGDRLATVEGAMADILLMERTALNFLQRLSGVATQTRRFVDACAGLAAKILDTRKTTPGWRLLEKYAVRCGGGHNYRTGLYDGVLIKDNHLAALGGGPSAVAEAVRLARTRAPEGVPVEVEVDDLDQLGAALAARVDIVLLDNMSLDAMREAVRRRDAVAPTVQLEASGGVNLATVRGIAETGVDRISVGALTHSAPALDIALDYDPL